MSAADVARRAANLRAVLDECERVLGDPTASPERREIAQRWHDRLGGIGSLADNAYGYGLTGGGTERHHNGGGLSLRADAVYDGWGSE